MGRLNLHNCRCCCCCIVWRSRRGERELEPVAGDRRSSDVGGGEGGYRWEATAAISTNHRKEVSLCEYLALLRGKNPYQVLHIPSYHKTAQWTQTPWQIIEIIPSPELRSYPVWYLVDWPRHVARVFRFGLILSVPATARSRRLASQPKVAGALELINHRLS